MLCEGAWREAQGLAQDVVMLFAEVDLAIDASLPSACLPGVGAVFISVALTFVRLAHSILGSAMREFVPEGCVCRSATRE